ncbi:hypothetical protein ACFSE1_11490 [Rhizobium helianthi]|uniref:Uncharacterized protein n=1 Tax=Rhizobium helianthi TaxID=1132695 RepID=A0ABW4M6J1_9HYPH
MRNFQHYVNRFIRQIQWMVGTASYRYRKSVERRQDDELRRRFMNG